MTKYIHNALLRTCLYCGFLYISPYIKAQTDYFLYIYKQYTSGKVKAIKHSFRSLKSAFCFSTSPKAPCWRFPILAMTMYEQAQHCSFGLTKTLACLHLKNIIQNTARTLLLADVKFYLQTARWSRLDFVHCWAPCRLILDGIRAPQQKKNTSNVQTSKREINRRRWNPYKTCD